VNDLLIVYIVYFSFSTVAAYVANKFVYREFQMVATEYLKARDATDAIDKEKKKLNNKNKTRIKTDKKMRKCGMCGKSALMMMETY